MRFSTRAQLAEGRNSHTATVLSDGKILVAGGNLAYIQFTASAEIYDPATGSFSITGSLGHARGVHTATLLPNRKVLVIGGGHHLPSELYDPDTGLWTLTSQGSLFRSAHTATRLSDGTVLVVGGTDNPTYPGGSHQYTTAAELYDPATDTWTPTGPLGVKRGAHTATLLQDGKVLVVGGTNSPFERLNTAEIYDPATKLWSPIAMLSEGRIGHTSTLLADGCVLIVSDSVNSSSGEVMTEIYNPVTGLWKTVTSPNYTRRGHTAILMPDNTVMVTGGETHGDTSEIYHPDTGIWTFADSLTTGRKFHTAALLPGGNVLVTGGIGMTPKLQSANMTSSEILAPTELGWQPAAEMKMKRTGHSMSTLPDGRVLAAGGVGEIASRPEHPGPITSAEIYDPVTGDWELTGMMATARANHPGILLRNGKVLVIGGGAEIYDPSTGLWSAAGSLPVDLYLCNATLMQDGTVLATGGLKSGIVSKLCFRYDPATNAWNPTGSLRNARLDHTANLLPDGRVLAHGGVYGREYYEISSTCEIYDPLTGLWTKGGSSLQTRRSHTATVLPSGRVLVCGGEGVVTPNTHWLVRLLDRAEIYDPATRIWSPTAPMAKAHGDHVAALFADGRLLVAGGQSPFDPDNSAEGINTTEIYSEVSGKWEPTGPLRTPRVRMACVTLNDGRILAAGGFGPASYYGERGHFTASSEIYDPQLPRLKLECLGINRVDGGIQEFESVRMGDRTSLSFTIRNSGTAEIAGLTLSITGADATSFLVSEPLPDATAAPGESLGFTVTFSPTAAGKKNALLNIKSNAGDDGQHQIFITGEAVARAPEVVVEQPAKTSLVDGKTKKSFGTVKVGKSGAAKTFTIKNTGTANLTKLAVMMDGNDKSDFTVGVLGKTTVTPGTSTTFKVTFEPGAKGKRDATINIRSNDADENPFEIKLTGMGASR